MDIKYLDEKAIGKKSSEGAKERPKAVYNGNGKWYAG